MLIEGPYGRLHEGVRTRRRVLLLAAGIGITPIKALLESLCAEPGDVTVIYRVSDLATAPLLAGIEDAAVRCGARLVVLEGHRSLDRPSWLPSAWAHLPDEAALRHLVPDVAERDVFLCGGTAWMDAAENAARAAGVPVVNIHAERFTY